MLQYMYMYEYMYVYIKTIIFCQMQVRYDSVANVTDGELVINMRYAGIYIAQVCQKTT